MSKWIPLAILTTLLFACKSTNKQEPIPEVLLMDAKYLAQSKMRIENNDTSIMPAFDQLLEEADAALAEGPYSVTDKVKLPPSGNKHDYASYSRYWWPDPTKPDGLPYIRKDGETYPGSQSLEESDRQRIGALGVNTETLGLAYYFTGEEKYAEKAAQLLRVWFIDDETRMNPNVNHAQCRPGHNTGTKSGILDGRLLTRALEGSLLISESGALSNAEHQQLKEWATEYFQWLTTNKMALDEAASRNNHGSYYDAQAMYFALYTDNQDAAIRIAENFVETRLYRQIKPDGSMPEEMARTRPLFYSNYNLHAMFLVAHLAKQVGVDVYETTNSDSRLRAGLDYVVPYADSNKDWPQPSIGTFNRLEIYPILLMAEIAYPDGNYLDLAEMLPIDKQQAHRSNLASPIMR